MTLSAYVCFNNPMFNATEHGQMIQTGYQYNPLPTELQQHCCICDEPMSEWSEEPNCMACDRPTCASCTTDCLCADCLKVCDYCGESHESTAKRDGDRCCDACWPHVEPMAAACGALKAINFDTPNAHFEALQAVEKALKASPDQMCRVLGRQLDAMHERLRGQMLERGRVA